MAEGGDDEDDEEEHVDEIMGEVNDWDQTLLGAGLGGANAEEEEAALRLQEQLARQRQQRERTPPFQAQGDGQDTEDESEDLRRRLRNLQDLSPRRRQRMASPPPGAEWSQLLPPSPEGVVVDEDGRPVIPDPPSPLPLDLTGDHD